MLSFPPETATAILSLKLNMWYLETVALTLFSMDSAKHFWQSFSPEYGLKKKAGLRLQRLHTVVAAFLSIGFHAVTGLIGTYTK